MYLLHPNGKIVGYNMHNNDPTKKFHGNMIEEGHVSIQVMTSTLDDYKLPIPSEYATTMGEALWCFMIWETNLLWISYKLLDLNNQVR